jgi:hypothetical protein
VLSSNVYGERYGYASESFDVAVGAEVPTQRKE